MFHRKPRKLDPCALLERLREHIGAVEFMEDTGKGGSPVAAYLFMEHPTLYPSGDMLPAQCAVLNTKGMPTHGAYQETLKHSLNWQSAADMIARCTASRIVTDLMASELAPAERLWLFNRLVKAVVEVEEPAAIHWMPSQKLIRPEEFMFAMEAGENEDPLVGALNVRLFDVEDAEGTILMDTTGLAAFGLPDLQMHFHSLPKPEVAAILASYAAYLFDRGRTVQHEDAFVGIDGKSWPCRAGVSAASPDRLVLDIDPGPEFRG